MSPLWPPATCPSPSVLLLQWRDTPLPDDQARSPQELASVDHSTAEMKEMDMMDVRVSTRDVQQFDGDALAVGVFSDSARLHGPAAALDEALAGVIAGLRASGEVTGAAGEVTLLHTLGKIEPTRVAIVGLGPRKRFSPDEVRKAAAIACRALRKAGARRVGLALAWAESGVNL